MEDIDDDFGELYADVEVQATSAINPTPRATQLRLNDHTLGGGGRGEENSEPESDNGVVGVGVGIGGESESEEEEEEDDDEDDFVVVVNDEDYEAKSGGGGEERKGGEEVREDVEVEVGVGGTEANVSGKREMLEDGGGEVGNGGCGSQFKHVRKYGSAFMGNQRGINSRRADREDIGYTQPRRSGSGRFPPAYAGSTVSGSAEYGNGFSLPWYRTIFDVDIDMFEQKPWTLTGADMTDYFNFGFNEESWRSYCQSVDQLRQQSSTPTRNRENRSLGSKQDLFSEEYVDMEFVPTGNRQLTHQESNFAVKQFERQIGQAIHVEDSNSERLPSMDLKRPRSCDPDVVIQIIARDPEESGSGMKSDDKLVTKSEVSEKGCVLGNFEQETERSEGLKSCKTGMVFTEENVSSSSSDLRRSFESATVSSHVIQEFSVGKELNSESDAQNSRKTNTISGGNLNTLMEDAYSDRNTTETNPCVAGIDLSFDDHVQSSTTPSYSNTQSEASKDDDHCDIRKTRDSRGSSPDSVMQGSHVARDDCHRSRVGKRDHTRRETRCHNYTSRVRDSIEKDRKYSKGNFPRHSELKSHSHEHDKYPIGTAGHNSGRRPSRLHHHRSEELRSGSTFNDEDTLSYREKRSSLGFYDEHSAENQFRAKYMRDPHRQNHWGSEDERDLYAKRERDEENFYSERRNRRMRGDVVLRDCYLEERESMVRDGNPMLQGHQGHPHLLSKYSSSVDMVRWNKHREYDDVNLSNRSKHDLLLQDRYFDAPDADRCARPIPLDVRQRGYLDSENEHERRLRHTARGVGSSCRGDEFFDYPSSDLEYPRYVKKDHEYWNREIFPSTPDSCDRQPAYAGRRHHDTFSRDDCQSYQRYERHSRYISPKKVIEDIQTYDYRDAGNSDGTVRYLDEVDFFGKRRNVPQSKDMNWGDDALFDHLNDDFYDEDMLDSFKGVARHKWHGAKDRYMSSPMQYLKGGNGVMDDGGDRSSKIPKRAKHEETVLWSRNPVKVRHIVRERKSTGNFSKAGDVVNNDACARVGGRFKKHLKKQLVPDPSCSEKAMENKSLQVGASQNRSSIFNNEDASDLEEGQIPLEGPTAENVNGMNYGPGYLAQEGIQKGRSSHSQKPMSQNDSCVYDENRILETMAKMEKRRERFKEPTVVKKDIDSDPKPPVDNLIESAESKGQRPARKRQWCGS